jgi:hypothetical protein
MTALLPLLILAGSDQRPGPLPEGFTAADVLSGFKGALPLPGGRCLVAELVERFRDSRRFADPLVIGPRSVYAGLVDCEVVDVEGSLADTLSRAIQLLAERYDPALPVATSSCDILPTSSEIRSLLETQYDPHSQAHFWWQVVTARRNELGSSAWKPRYAMQPGPGLPLQHFYPGHLVILRPGAVRLQLLSRLLVAAYRNRNLPLRQRFLPMLLEGIGLLLRQDIANVSRLQWPALTWSVPWHIFRAYRGIRRESLTLPEFEQHLCRTVVHRQYRQGPRPFAISVTTLSSFAKDIDTVAELEEITAAQASTWG